MSIVTDIVSGLAKPVGDYVTRRAEIKAQERQFAAQQRMKEHELKMAQMDRQAQLVRDGLAADATWELESLKAHADGWKDEAVLIVLATPMILCFIPGLAPYVQAGFAALSVTPWWYQTATISVFLATYGIRWFRRQQSDT